MTFQLHYDEETQTGHYTAESVEEVLDSGQGWREFSREKFKEYVLKVRFERQLTPTMMEHIDVYISKPSLWKLFKDWWTR